MKAVRDDKGPEASLTESDRDQRYVQQVEEDRQDSHKYPQTLAVYLGRR